MRLDMQDAQKDIAALMNEIQELKYVLADCADYFDNRADADCDQDGFIPNAEMILLMAIKEVL